MLLCVRVCVFYTVSYIELFGSRSQMLSSDIYATCSNMLHSVYTCTLINQGSTLSIARLPGASKNWDGASKTWDPLAQRGKYNYFRFYI